MLITKVFFSENWIFDSVMISGYTEKKDSSKNGVIKISSTEASFELHHRKKFFYIFPWFKLGYVYGYLGFELDFDSIMFCNLYSFFLSHRKTFWAYFVKNGRTKGLEKLLAKNMITSPSPETKIHFPEGAW